MNNESNLEAHPLESLTLFSGVSERTKVLILVSGKRMAVSADSGPDDVWRNKKHIKLRYVYEPLILSNYTNLEKVW